MCKKLAGMFLAICAIVVLSVSVPACAECCTENDPALHSRRVMVTIFDEFSEDAEFVERVMSHVKKTFNNGWHECTSVGVMALSYEDREHIKLMITDALKNCELNDVYSVTITLYDGFINAEYYGIESLSQCLICTILWIGDIVTCTGGTGGLHVRRFYNLFICTICWQDSRQFIGSSTVLGGCFVCN